MKKRARASAAHCRRGGLVLRARASAAHGLSPPLFWRGAGAPEHGKQDSRTKTDERFRPMPGEAMGKETDMERNTKKTRLEAGKKIGKKNNPRRVGRTKDTSCRKRSPGTAFRAGSEARHCLAPLWGGCRGRTCTFTAGRLSGQPLRGGRVCFSTTRQESNWPPWLDSNQQPRERIYRIRSGALPL